MLPLMPSVAGASVAAPTIYDEIRTEFISTADHPLPLAAHWNTGWTGWDPVANESTGYDPAYYVAKVDAGRHLLPCFGVGSGQRDTDYYTSPITWAKNNNLPICATTGQWEDDLHENSLFFDLPIADNPNQLNLSNVIVNVISPLGAIPPWFDVGDEWSDSPTLQDMISIYPTPPMIQFMSNNEARTLDWVDATLSKRYMDDHDPLTDEQIRQLWSDGWVARYPDMFDGLRFNMTAAWQNKSVYVGYNVVGPAHFARWSSWRDFSLTTVNNISPWPLVWDGGSPSFYVHDWNASTDYKVHSPQIEAMNWVFMQEHAVIANADYRAEMSVWDGGSVQRQVYIDAGQTFTPARYGGTIKFGMWLLRPRVVREFRFHDDTVEDTEQWFIPIMDAVDSIYTNPIFEDFWRNGDLVANTAASHPYQVAVPAEYASEERWFLLITDLDPARPWTTSTELPVFALALTFGAGAAQEWLIYAHSPLADRTNVDVTLPGYGSNPVTMDVGVGGTYWHITDTAEVEITP